MGSSSQVSIACGNLAFILAPNCLIQVFSRLPKIPLLNIRNEQRNGMLSNNISIGQRARGIGIDQGHMIHTFVSLIKGDELIT
jgi:hypothetical protein